MERFRREAQNAAGLNHPNIVSIFDRGQAEGTYYIAMEFLDGRTLKELARQQRPDADPDRDRLRAPDPAARSRSRTGTGSSTATSSRTTSSSAATAALKVTDFGIARSGASQMTEAGSIVGTAQYLSPEQARGAPVDPRSDLYSLGIVLYEMLTGTVPFAGDAPVEIAMKHLQTVPEPPSTLRPEVPHDLDAVVMRALAKDPDERFDSAEEMDADLAPRRPRPRGLAAHRGGDDAGDARAPPPRRRGRAPAAPARAAGRAARLPAARAPYYGYRSRRAGARRGRGCSACSRSRSERRRGYLLYERIQNQLNENKPVGVGRRRPAAVAAREAEARAGGLPSS